MVEGGGGPSFPVVFFDGERESNLGDVNINPTLEYKPFQLMLSQKIGISPNQISIYIVDRQRNSDWPFSDERRRVPITGKVNFAAICRLKGCHFLVVLKRSRKSRNRRERATEITNYTDNDFFPSTSMMQSVATENLVLLRRNRQSQFYEEIAPSDLANLNNRLQNLSFQGENFTFISPNFTSSHNRNPLSFHTVDSTSIVDDPFGINSLPTRMATRTKSGRLHCEECANAKASFHRCVNDPVIVRFRTRFGPICRPPGKPIL